MTPQELYDTYCSFSTTQLLQAYNNPGDYTPEAKEALMLVIQKRGGIEALQANHQFQQSIKLETERIRQQVRQLRTPETDLDFLNKIIQSDLLEESQKEAIVQQSFEEITREWEDKQVKPRTLIGGAIAAAIASLTGGILWGLQMIWSGRIFVFFFFGLVLLCYGLIRLITKQSYKNNAVLILVIISVALALFIGQVMLNVFGKE